jgi:hypothetical protein
VAGALWLKEAVVIKYEAGGAGPAEGRPAGVERHRDNAGVRNASRSWQPTPHETLLTKPIH